MVKIVVCDDTDGAFQKSGELERLKPAGALIVYGDVAETREEVVERLAGVSIAVAIRDRTALDRQTLASLTELKLIASTGPHRIDIKAATELGIVVAGTPGTSTSSVGEHVFGMILSLARRIAVSDQALRQRRWESSPGVELEGKILGILGLGRTGGAVARRAPAFGLQVIAWGPSLTEDRAASVGARMVSEEELFRTADILSVHLRRSEWSVNFVSASRLARMKPSAWLIDISWSGIVDRKALAAALGEQRIAGAALDLCDTYPVDGNDPILDAPNTVLTPHLAWQTVESYQRSARMAVDNILAYLGGKPLNVVNPEALRSGNL
ncbi:MAG: D-2-hydroxyacid dehydrogenase family protein [Deltaproteobacteria bacterium]|nr:D-2-hydroxyacid dehydrogenase family protein [Deltaproteobacteria bacterium]